MKNANTHLTPRRKDAKFSTNGFRADLIDNDLVFIELKSVEKIHPVHKKQLLTYLRLASRHLGLLINFGEERIMDGITRIANNLREESID